MKDNKTKVFVLTKDELIKMRGTHGFGSWKIACTGCRKEFTDTDIGGTIVSVSRDAKRVLPKIPVRRT